MSTFFLYLKKFFLYLFYPSTLIFLFLILVSIYVILEKRRGRRRFLLFLAIFLYYLSTTPLLPYLLLKPLEEGLSPPKKEEIQKVSYAVLLTGGVYSGQNFPANEIVTGEGLRRIMGTASLLKNYPKLKLIVIGGSYEFYREAEVYAQIFDTLGIKVQSEETPLDTESAAKVLGTIIPKHEPFLLLSSAYHLPRAVYLLKKEGLNPIPYPTHKVYHLCLPQLTLRNLFPRPLYLELSNQAIHEYLALTYYKLKDLLKIQ